MRRFEFVEGSSSKFWEIELEGSGFTVRWGRLGTAGQVQQKSFATEAKATAEHDKLIAEKTKKGYVETGASAAPAPAESPAAAAPAPKKPAKKDPIPEATQAPAAPAPAAPVVEASSAPAPAPSPVVIPAAAVAPHVDDAASEPVPDPRPILWNEALFRRVYARRGGLNVPVRPPASPKKAWAPIRERVARYVTLGRPPVKKPDPALIAAERGAFARLGSDEFTPGSAEEDAALLAFAQHKLTWEDKPNPDPLVDLLFTLGGPVHATHAVLLSFGLFVVPVEEDSMDVNHWTLGRRSDQSWWAKLSSGYLRSLPRLRELLATRTDDAEYAAARDAAAELRDKATAEQRAAAAFLFPTEANWVHAEVQAFTKDPSLDLIVCSVAERADLERMASHLNAHELLRKDYLPTLLDGAGPEALVLLRALVPSLSSAELRRTWAEAVGAINTDEAVDFLLGAVEDRDVRAIVNEVALRAPRRALRVLGPKAAARGKDGDPARAVLANVVRRWPAVVEAELAGLPEEARRAVAALRGQSGPEVAEAPPERLPPILANPPWQAKKAPAALPVIADVEASIVPDAMLWEPGERDAWRSRQGQDSRWYAGRTPQQWEAVERGDDAWMRGVFFACAPEAVARKYLADYRANNWNDPSWWPALIARFEKDVLPAVLEHVESAGGESWELLRPYAFSSLAPALAAGLGTKKSRASARAVLLRHPEHFAAGLLPGALGKPGKAKDAACAALRLLATSGHEATVLEVAGRVSAEVRDAVSAVLSFDPLLRFPAKPPKLPAFFDASSLPAPLLKEPLARLPVAAVEALGQMLAFSDPEAPYAGLALVKEACEPKSLARFAWALFEAWLMAAAPSKEAWAFHALGVFGDDECVRKLAPLIREWPGEAAHARAVMGLDVLAAIGTDVALMYLNGIAEKAKFKGLQQKAQEKISQIAEARGLSRDELADRLVPDLGLEENGSLSLDFGERSFTVGFDEQLKPYVKDAEGARLKDLPKPTKKDDAEKAKAAEERWKALKKDAKAVAATQLLRMELGMCGRRRWDAATFRLFFVQHPLLVHIVRRLIWGVYGEDGKLLATFRVAEDRTFSDAEDTAFTLPDDAQVGLPHAMELDEAVAGAWGQLLADYELLQPFPQLGRPVYTLKPEEGQATGLARVKGVTVPTGKVLGLEAHGWRRGAPQDAGIVCWMEKRLGEDRVVMLDLDPGIYTGAISESPEQTLGEASLRSSVTWGQDEAISIAKLDPILLSELIRDLEGLRG